MLLIRKHLLPLVYRAALGLAVAAGPLAAPCAAQPGSETDPTYAPANGVQRAFVRASIWAVAAAYEYQDNPKLVKIHAELLATINNSSVPNFNRGVEVASEFEQKYQPGQSEVARFQAFCQNIQNQQYVASVPGALAKALIEGFGAEPARQSTPVRKQRFRKLVQRLQQLGAGAKPAVTSIEAAAFTVESLSSDTSLDESADTAPVAGRVLDAGAAALQNATTDAPQTAKVLADPASARANVLGWAALCFSLLSLTGVVYLIRRPQLMAPVAAPAPREPSVDRQQRREFRWEEIKSYINREMDRRLAEDEKPPAAGPKTV